MDLFARAGGTRQCIQNAHLVQAIQRRDIQLHFALQRIRKMLDHQLVFICTGTVTTCPCSSGAAQGEGGILLPGDKGIMGQLNCAAFPQ